MGQDRAYTKVLCLVSRCDKMVAASKRFTVHRAPRVLTVCLKRFEDFTGRKINKVSTQPEGDVFLPGAGYFPKRSALSQAVEFFRVPFWKEKSCRGKTRTYSAPLWPRIVSCHPNHYL